tara:strand:+ start:60 stop:527 length:468 start_codon:yes stop_codon:yes gene_type:complete
MAFRMKGPFFFKKHKHKKSGHDFVHEGGYKIVREKLEDGVLGEAENGNIIKIDISVEEGSAQESEVVNHEGKHLTEMGTKNKDGEPLLSYDENSVTDNIAGITYTRKDGNLINDKTGEVFEEGDKRLPHEVRAWAAGKKAKSAFTRNNKKRNYGV